MKKRFLCLLLSAALLLMLLPATAFADTAELRLDRENIGNSGAVFTAKAGKIISAVSSDESIAVCAFDGDEVTVSGIPGAVGIARITVTAKVGGSEVTDSYEVPIGYTTFILDGYNVTVIESDDTNYEVVGLNPADEEERILPTSTDAHGNTVYTGSEEAVPFIAIKKNGGVYVFEGSSANAGIVVKKEAKNDAFLLLNGLDLTSAFTSPITVKKDSQASVIITALEGTVNTLTDAAFNNSDDYGPIEDGGDGSNQYYAESAVIKAKTGATVYLNGEGTLNLNANAKNAIKCGVSSSLEIADMLLNVVSVHNGISSDSEIDIVSGTVNITTSGNDAVKAENDDATEGIIIISGGDITINSADEGIVAADSIIVYGGTFDITCGGDALKAENLDESDGDIFVYDGSFTIESEGDGFQTAGELTVYGGSFDITCCGGHTNTSYNKDTDPSAKGMKSGNGSFTVYGGSFAIDSADDSIHSNSNMYIHGGTFTLSSGDDGVHADYLMVLGDRNGDDSLIDLTVADSYEGIEAANIYILSGNYEVNSDDDCINAANGDLSGYSFLLRMYGGNVVCHGCTGDGVDSNGEFSVAGGQLEVYAPGNGNSALDSDGSMNLVGGTTIGVGSSDMVQTPNSGVYVQFGGGWNSSISFASGDTLAIYNSSNTKIFESIVQFYGSARNASHVLFASSLLTSGQTYYLYKNGSRLSSATASGSSGSIAEPPEFGENGGSAGWKPVGELGSLYTRVTAMTAGIPTVITNTGNTYALAGGSSISGSAVTVTASGSAYSITGITESSTWYLDNSGHIYCIVNGSNYYLMCSVTSSGWNSTYSLTTTTDSGSASAWTVAQNGNYVRISTAVTTGGPGGPGGPGGGPGGSRTLYLYNTGSTFSVSTSANNLYMYSPETAIASLVGTTSHIVNIDNGESITEAEVLAAAEIHYKANLAANEEVLAWDNALVTYEWNTPLAMEKGSYILSVSVSGTYLGSISVAVVSPGSGSSAPIPHDPAPVDEPEPGLLGDVNSDGVVDLTDAMTLCRYVLGIIGADELDLSVADMDGSGSINNIDSVLIMRLVLDIGL